MITLRLVCFALIAALGSATAQPKKPKLPPGLDPGGQAIVLLTTGIDYTKPELASRLARDGEGDLIGLDTIDGDNRPYETSGEGTALAIAVSKAPTIRIIPVRIDPDHPPSLIAAVKFAARSPGRVIVMPQLPADAAKRSQLLAGLTQFPDRIFILPVPSDGAAIPTGANVFAIAPAGLSSPAADLLVGTDPPLSSYAVADFMLALATCGDAEIAKLQGSAPKLKALLKELALRAKPDPAVGCLLSVPVR